MMDIIPEPPLLAVSAQSRINKNAGHCIESGMIKG